MVSTTATWTGDVVGDANDYNNAGNWTGDDGPPSDTANFDSSGATLTITVTAIAQVGEWNILDDQSYIFTLDADFDFTGTGITIVGGSSAAITNNATLSFTGTSLAGTAHITTANGATTQFLGTSNAASARLTVGAGGAVDFSGTGVASLTAGSIEGGGGFLLGANHLTVQDGNDLLVSGSISGTGGALTLAGGQLFLSGANTYTSGTTISSGAELVLGDSSLFGSTAGSIVGDVSNNGTLTFNRSNAYQFDGIVSGTGDVQQTGEGTTTLTAANTYTGVTLIDIVGTLALSGDGSIEDSSVIDGQGVLDISGHTGDVSVKSLTGEVGVNLGANTLIVTAANHSYGGDLGGTGGLTLMGGTLTLTDVFDYTGMTFIALGTTLRLANVGDISQSSNVVVHGDFNISGQPNAQIVTLNGTGTVTLGNGTLILTAASGDFFGSIQGTGGFVISSGTQILRGVNTYAGETFIDAGTTLQLVGAGTLENSSVVTANGEFDISAHVGDVTLVSLAGASTGVVDSGVNSLILTNASGNFAGGIVGTSGLRVTGGTQTLSGDNQYSGATTISSGATLALAGTGAIEDSSGVLVNGTLNISGVAGSASIATLSGTGTVTLGSNTLELDNAAGTFSGSIGGTGGFMVSVGTQTLNGTSSVTGTTTIVFGATLNLNDAGSLAGSTVVAGGTFDISDHIGDTAVAGLTGGGTGLVDLGTNTLNITNASGSFAGQVTGAGGLFINGGTQTLSGNNSYTGVTTVNGGTLQVDGDIVSSSGVTVNNGGTLAGGGATGNVAVNAGGTLGPGSSTDILTTGSVTFTTGATFAVEFNGLVPGTEYDQLAANGTVTLGNATLDVTLDFAPTLLDDFIVIDNLGVDPVSGTFAGLPDGATFLTAFAGLNFLDGVFFEIDYQGGDGNDVTLTTVGEHYTGNSAANVINSGDGDNVMLGLGGKDTLTGGVGSDDLTGGGARDTLTGGNGADNFIYTAVGDSRAKKGQFDIITDFVLGFDLMDLSQVDANSKQNGNQTFKWIGKQQFHDKAGELRYEAHDNRVLVQGDTNGDGKADFQIQLNSLSTLSADDLIL